jgi:hypothetical protein
MSKITVAIVTVAALVSSCGGGAKSAVSQPSKGDLIVNGSFEEPQLAGGYKILPAVPGWKVSFGPGIELQHGVNGSSKDGAQHVELDSTENTGIEQTVSTTAASILALSFAYSPRPGRPAATNGVEVRVDGKVVLALAEDGTPFRDSNWSPHVIAFTAAGSNATVEFRGTGTSDGFGGYIDDVKLTHKD